MEELKQNPAHGDHSVMLAFITGLFKPHIIKHPCQA